MKNEANFIAWVGAGSSLVAIFVFLTGKSTLPSLFDRASSQPTAKPSIPSVQLKPKTTSTKSGRDLNWAHGIRFKYKGASFRTNSTITDALLPIKKRSDTEVSLLRENGAWLVKEKGSYLPIFWITTADNRVDTINICSSKISVNGIKDVHIGDTTEEIFLKLGAPNQTVKNTYVDSPSKTGNDYVAERALKKYMEKVKASQKGASVPTVTSSDESWSNYIYYIGRDRMELFCSQQIVKQVKVQLEVVG